MSEAVVAINSKEMLSKRDFEIICPSLGERDRQAIKEIRKQRRLNSNK